MEVETYGEAHKLLVGCWSFPNGNFSNVAGSHRAPNAKVTDSRLPVGAKEPWSAELERQLRSPRLRQMEGYVALITREFGNRASL